MYVAVGPHQLRRCPAPPHATPSTTAHLHAPPPALQEDEEEDTEYADDRAIAGAYATSHSHGRRSRHGEYHQHCDRRHHHHHHHHCDRRLCHRRSVTAIILPYHLTPPRREQTGQRRYRTA